MSSDVSRQADWDQDRVLRVRILHRPWLPDVSDDSVPGPGVHDHRGHGPGGQRHQCGGQAGADHDGVLQAGLILQDDYNQDDCDSGPGANGQDILDDDPDTGEEAQDQALVGGYKGQAKEEVCGCGETKRKLMNGVMFYFIMTPLRYKVLSTLYILLLLISFKSFPEIFTIRSRSCFLDSLFCSNFFRYSAILPLVSPLS